MMPTRPPGFQVLDAKDPILAICGVDDRQASLRKRSLRAVVVPVEPFASRDVRKQVLRIVDRAEGGIGVTFAIASVRERHVIVDADEVDVGMRPQRIKVEIDVSVDMIAEILGPVGRIADLDLGPYD